MICFPADIEWLARTPLVIVELHDWLLPKAAHRAHACNAFRSSIATSSILVKTSFR